MASRKKFSVIVSTVNGCETLLKPCLESLRQYTDFKDVEVLVVANGSSDDTVEYVKSLGPPFSVHFYPEPLGFVGANNAGVEKAQGEFLVLLNNDTLILPSPKNAWLEKLHAPFQDRNVGISGPMKVFSRETNTDFIIFFCAMIRRECWLDVGGLDPVFGSFGEDVDFCRKAELKNWKVVQVPEQKLTFDGKMGIGDFPIYHKSHQTLGGMEGLETLIHKNLQLLRERYGAPKTLETLYDIAVATPSDIHEHLPTLRRYAEGMHVTEFGTRTGVSTVAFLAAKPSKLMAYDLTRHPEIDELERVARENNIPFQFISKDVRTVTLEETDILFLDTWHVYEQVKAELCYAPQVRKYIILHDTQSFGTQGETPGHEGILKAISEFVEENPKWKVAEVYPNNNGLTILARQAHGYRRIEV